MTEKYACRILFQCPVEQALDENPNQRLGVLSYICEA
ncbi:hypothetical protein GGP81_001911 [Salinibacter ruber]|nr:hypothetical protein [Salinibacter ruber]